MLALLLLFSQLEVVSLIILVLQFLIIRIKHRCRSTHCDSVGNRFSQIDTHYGIWHKLRQNKNQRYQYNNFTPDSKKDRFWCLVQCYKTILTCDLYPIDEKHCQVYPHAFVRISDQSCIAGKNRSNSVRQCHTDKPNEK